MNDSINQNSKFWLIPEFNNLELFRAKGIHHTYTRHSHPGYSIGIIEDGVGAPYAAGFCCMAKADSRGNPTITPAATIIKLLQYLRGGKG